MMWDSFLGGLAHGLGGWLAGRLLKRLEKAMAANETEPVSGTLRGFTDLPCLRCGKSGKMFLHLEDVEEFECQECGETFGPDDIEAAIEAWRPVLDWVKNAPFVEV